ncbi:spermatogenesis associated 6-like protein isoform X1 [Myotis myotis]|uniref:spermatogenesis associated 6-like protein isoform X1 n=1 Tax=Myotis myotis TaxID=51298 RepID=UPI00174A6517|nr:spermatogenesis associated 6-like protein isoform X1 [Myotis myotis]
MPLEVVVELQIRAISCPGVFLPDKQDVYLGVYLLNQYLETNCFPSVFPIMIQQRMRFQKLFENAIDPGAVADILEMWEELAYYEENTREFLFPEPKLTPSIPGIGREVLMKTAAGFPGIAPKIEFSTRTAIRECVFLHRNRFLEEMFKSRRPLFTSYGPTFPLKNKHMKRREINLNRLPQCVQFWEPSPYSTRRFFQDQTAQLNLGNNFKIPGESKPPFVVRHVDSAKPFGEDISEHYSPKSRRKSKFPNFPFPMRRGTQVSCYSCVFLYGSKCILLLNFSFCGMFSLETWSLILKYSPAVEFPGKEFLLSRVSREAVSEAVSPGHPLCSGCVHFLAGLEKQRAVYSGVNFLQMHH